MTARVGRSPVDWLNVLGVIVPVVFVACGWLLTTLRPEESSRISLIAFATTAIFGFCLSNLIRNLDLAHKFGSFAEAERTRDADIESKLEGVISQSRILANLADDGDVASVEQYARWLAANRALAQEVREVANFCAWQRSQIQNLLSAKTRECRDYELIVDDAVKELTSNTDLLLTVPKNEVIAISFEDTPFWKSDEGRRFLESHKLVIDRGVRVTRIFVLKGSDLAELSSVMDEQVLLGIDVYVIDYASVQHLHPGDAVIYDQTLIRKGYNSIETQNNMFKKAKIVGTKAAITAEIERSQALKAIARKWTAKTDADS